MKTHYVLALAVLAVAAFGQTLGVVSSDGPRPLNDALQSIERWSKTPIFYEEIPHENLADLVPGAELGANPAFHYLRGGELKVDLTNFANSPLLAARATVNAYVAQGLPGTYSVEGVDGDVVVIPNTMTNAREG